MFLSAISFRTLRMVLGLIGVALITTGCFDIEEEVTLNQDGSGTYLQRIDMSGFMAMLEGFGGDETTGTEMFDSMDSSMQVTANNMRDLPGISNVASRSEGYVFSVSCDFAEIDALNRAIKQNQSSTEGAADSPLAGLNSGDGANYLLKGKTFIRKDAPIDARMDEMEEEEKQQLQMAKMMMSDASYKLIYHLPGEVKRMTNEAATLSADSRTVTLDLSFVDLLEGRGNIGNEIEFK